MWNDYDDGDTGEEYDDVAYGSFIESVNGALFDQAGIQNHLMETFLKYRDAIGETRFAIIIEFDAALRKLSDDCSMEELDTVIDKYGSEAFRLLKCVESWEDEKKNAKAELASILSEYEYNVENIQKALEAATLKLEIIQGREDWVCDCHPSPQGFADASDLQNERIAIASQTVGGLSRAIELLAMLQK